MSLKYNKENNSLTYVNENGRSYLASPDISPKFSGLTKEDFLNNKFVYDIEPMSCKEGNIKSEELFKDAFILEDKLDGHRGILQITPKGNLLFSRRISKKTGWWNESSDTVPHLRDLSLIDADSINPLTGKNDFVGTVLDGEIVSFDFESVQSIVNSLPENAIKFQIENDFAVYHVFDCLVYKGFPLHNFPLWKRKLYLGVLFRNNPLPDYFRNVLFYSSFKYSKEYANLKKNYHTKNFCFYDEPVPRPTESKLDYVKAEWDNGREGVILKNINSKYEMKRSNNWIKIKEERTDDLIIMGFEEATKEYDGKTLKEKGFWDYWEDSSGNIIKERLIGKEHPNLIPVTKPYAMGWIGAIVGGVYKGENLVEIARVKGIKDKDQEYIKKSKEKLIGTVIEVKSQRISDEKIKSLRHPRFYRWRKDKDASLCTWDSIN